MAQAINERLFGASRIDPDAASKGWVIGKDAGHMSSQAGPAAFVNTAVDKYKESQLQRAQIQQEQQKARAAKLQQMLMEANQIKTGLASKYAMGGNLTPRELAQANNADQFINSFKSNPMMQQLVGIDPSKSATGISLTDLLALNMANQMGLGGQVGAGTQDDDSMVSGGQGMTGNVGGMSASMPGGSSVAVTKIGPSGPTAEVLNPGFEQQRAVSSGQAKATEKSFENAQKLQRAVGIISSIGKQFQSAIPDIPGEENYEKRIRSYFEEVGATTGLKPNPELLAIKKLQKPFAIQVIRALGEVGNLSTTEQQAALDTLSFGGLTSDEINAVVGAFAKTALAAMPEEAKKTLLNNPDSQALFKAFGIDTGSGSSGSGIDYNSALKAAGL